RSGAPDRAAVLRLRRAAGMARRAPRLQGRGQPLQARPDRDRSKDPKGIKDIVRGPVYSGGNVKATGTTELWDADQKTGGEVTYKNKDMSDTTIFPAPNMKNGVQPELEM